MGAFWSKAAFVHRTLWQREPAYRWAVLLGPPPLIGLGLAALVVTALQATLPSGQASGAAAAWAHWTRPNLQAGQPFVEPTMPLPATDANGRYKGYQPGWRGELRPMTVDAAMEVDLAGPPIGSFTLDQPDIPLQRIAAAGPPGKLFAGLAQTAFVVQAPGLYEFSVRLSRSGTQSADCVTRLGSARHPMVRSVSIDTEGGTIMNYAPTQFRLEPGLFTLVVAVGCWRGDRVVDSGDLTVMVRLPGETASRPAAPDELMRPAQRPG
jgi:hypothetical protein